MPLTTGTCCTAKVHVGKIPGTSNLVSAVVNVIVSFELTRRAVHISRPRGT